MFINLEGFPVAEQNEIAKAIATAIDETVSKMTGGYTPDMGCFYLNDDDYVIIQRNCDNMEPNSEISKEDAF